MVGDGGVGLEDFSVSPSSLRTNFRTYQVLVGVGSIGGFGTKGLGPGLDNIWNAT